jgi:hypothetical protein
VRDDAGVRAIAMDRRVAVVTEAVWALADAAQLALAGRIAVANHPLERDEHGHVWTPVPDDGTVAFIGAAHSESAAAHRDAANSRAMGLLFLRLRERNPSIRSIVSGRRPASCGSRPDEYPRGDPRLRRRARDFPFNRTAAFRNAVPGRRQPI